ncbi:MAG TPA: hypothetical protein VM537_37025 [Anaerolineae bacterium]|nr:hypothetical protein [Anaerolineae bacterium]
MTATQTREAAVIEERLRALMEALGISLPRGYRIALESPVQAAFLDFCVAHPFGHITLEVKAGEPFLVSKEWEGGVERFLMEEGDDGR